MVIKLYYSEIVLAVVILNLFFKNILKKILPN